MKILFLILTSLCLQTDSATLKLWDANSKVTWSDFEGDIPEDIGFMKAVTSSKISIKSNFYEGEIPKYIVRSYFDKSKSWTITDSEEHLIHERLHFDITELYARKIRQKIDSLFKIEEKNVLCYKKMYEKILNDYEEAQFQYDNESYSDRVKQLEWQEKVAKELEELKKYEYVPEE
ncbi:hypothetical protein [Aquimarina sp. MMG016]|uniref:hypothetical protein n=1 Tax=Aquimarina sp. MMG016 TaxID=2822690 RepID=UPI001B39EFD5|nr:hypothetical protein [Aquimarina sp. MMG016]MBQ4822480.1 hypothetical protein [Aquimarina sp. MMG016]